MPAGEQAERQAACDRAAAEEEDQGLVGAASEAGWQASALAEDRREPVEGRGTGRNKARSIGRSQIREKKEAGLEHLFAATYTSHPGV